MKSIVIVEQDNGLVNRPSLAAISAAKKLSSNIESKFKMIAEQLAPDPLNIDRLILNRLFHQTPDMPDKKN